MSKKKFDGQIKAWRRQLHLFDDSVASAGVPHDASNKKRDHLNAFSPGSYAEQDPHQAKHQKWDRSKENISNIDATDSLIKSAGPVEALANWADDEDDEIQL